MIDDHVCDWVLDELERIDASGTKAEWEAMVAAITLVHDCSEDPRRLDPLPSVLTIEEENRRIRFKVYSYGGFEMILACPHRALSFKAVYFGAGLRHEQRRERLMGDLKPLWSEQ